MHHALVRQAMPRLIAGAHVAASHAALVLATSPGCPERTVQAMLARIGGETLGTDRYRGPIRHQPVPVDVQALVAQLAPAVIAHPADTAGALEGLLALVELWPHATQEERQHLRSRWLEGVASAQAPEESFVTSLQLSAWQKQLPTSFGALPASLASLRGVVSAEDALASYKVLCEHVGTRDSGFAVLARTLGSLAVQILLQRRDPHRQVAALVPGAAAAEALDGLIAPEILSTLLAQYSHRLWWTWREAGLQPLVSTVGETSSDIAAAVAIGDVTAAQRAARMAVREEGRFAAQTWGMLEAALAADDPRWELIVRLLAAIRRRAGNGSLLPEDAAAVAGVWADLDWSARS